MPAEEPSVWLGLHLNSRRNQVNDTFACEINAECGLFRRRSLPASKTTTALRNRAVRSSLTGTPRHVTTAAADIGVSLCCALDGRRGGAPWKSRQLRQVTSHGPSIPWGTQGAFEVSSESDYPFRHRACPAIDSHLDVHFGPCAPTMKRVPLASPPSDGLMNYFVPPLHVRTAAVAARFRARRHVYRRPHTHPARSNLIARVFRRPTRVPPNSNPACAHLR